MKRFSLSSSWAPFEVKLKSIYIYIHISVTAHSLKAQRFLSLPFFFLQQHLQQQPFKALRNWSHKAEVFLATSPLEDLLLACRDIDQDPPEGCALHRVLLIQFSTSEYEKFTQGNGNSLGKQQNMHLCEGTFLRDAHPIGWGVSEIPIIQSYAVSHPL